MSIDSEGPPLRSPELPITCLASDPDGSLLVDGREDGRLVVRKTPGFAKVVELALHRARVTDILWRQDSHYVATTSVDGEVVVLSANDWSEVRRAAIGSEGRALAWNPGALHIAVAGTGPITLINVSTGDHTTLADSAHGVSLSWSRAGDLLASSHIDGSIRLWDMRHGKIARRLQRRASVVYALAWNPGRTRHLAAATHLGSIEIWDADTGKLEARLEWHDAAVFELGFTASGDRLVARSTDGAVSIWRTSDWTLVESHFLRPPIFLGRSLAVVGDRDLFMIVGESPILRHLTLAAPDQPSQPDEQTARYTNAKVVLVGDTGVGKSALALALTGHKYRETDSTHGIHVWRFSAEQVADETREVYLWDLAGQPGYRLTHQLHLGNATLAILVFDARSETDPFSAVRYWSRALTQAATLSDKATIPRVLVAARIDRGGIAVSRSRRDAIVDELGAISFVETSARENLGIQDLRKLIAQNIEWEAEPKVSSGAFFDAVRRHVLNAQERYVANDLIRYVQVSRRVPDNLRHRLLHPIIDEDANTEAGHGPRKILARLQDLYEDFLERCGETSSAKLFAQFSLCIDRLAHYGILRLFSFGGFVLLQPELLDGYASAIVHAALDEPDGIGAVLESDLLEGRFPLPQTLRIADAQEEKLLLLATIEDLLKHEIAFREDAAGGRRLVFPSALSRDFPRTPASRKLAVTFRFTGPIRTIYAALVVRLSYSDIFRRTEMWRDGAIFTTSNSELTGLILSETGDGIASISLFFDDKTSLATRATFEAYVELHLNRRAVVGSIEITRHVYCTSCDTNFDAGDIQRRLARGLNWMRCHVCDDKLSLDVPAVAMPQTTQTVERIDQIANAQRDREVAAAELAGKVAVGDHDFLIISSGVHPAVTQSLLSAFKLRGRNPALVECSADPREWLGIVAERTGLRAMPIALVSGQSEPLAWSTPSLRALWQRCRESNVPLCVLHSREVNVINVGVPPTFLLSDPRALDAVSTLAVNALQPSVGALHIYYNATVFQGTPPQSEPSKLLSSSELIEQAVKDIAEHVRATNDLTVHVLVRLYALEEMLDGGEQSKIDGIKDMLEELWISKVVDEMKPKIVKLVEEHFPPALRSIALDGLKASIALTASS